MKYAMAATLAIAMGGCMAAGPCAEGIQSGEAYVLTFAGPATAGPAWPDYQTLRLQLPKDTCQRPITPGTRWMVTAKEKTDRGPGGACFCRVLDAVTLDIPARVSTEPPWLYCKNNTAATTVIEVGDLSAPCQEIWTIGLVATDKNAGVSARHPPNSPPTAVLVREINIVNRVAGGSCVAASSCSDAWLITVNREAKGN